MASVIQSTFNKDAQGWTMQDDSPLTWASAGKHQGGFITWSDSNGGDSYYSAPDAYLHDKHGFFGGRLSYDVKDTATEYSGVPDVELVGNNGTTLVATVGQAGTDFTHLSVNLDASGGWHVGSLDGALANKHQIKDVLKDLSALWIRAEYHVGDETGALDNVVLSKRTVEGGPDHGHDGHGGGAHHLDALTQAHPDLSYLPVV